LFAFAVGVMGSMLFSILALVVWLSVIFPFKKYVKRAFLQRNNYLCLQELFDSIVAQNQETRTVAKSLPTPSQTPPNHL
jgi:hypothetical protein